MSETTTVIPNSNVPIERRVIATLLNSWHPSGLDEECFVDETCRDVFGIMEKNRGDMVKIQVDLSSDSGLVQWVEELPPPLPNDETATTTLIQLRNRRKQLDTIAEYADDPTELRLRLETMNDIGTYTNAMNMFDERELTRITTGNPMRTHFPTMNNCFEVRNGELIVISAETSAGKTQLGLNLMRDFASTGHKALFVSMEMGLEAIEIRLQNMFLGKPINMIRTDASFKSNYALMRSGVKPEITNTLKNMNFYYYSSFFQDIAQQIYVLKPDVVIVDYFQLINSKVSKGEYEDQRYIAIALRQLALERPFIVLSQFKKKSQEGKRTLDDIYGSSALPQSASVSMFLTRQNPEASMLTDTITYSINKNRTWSTRAYDIPLKIGVDGMFTEGA